MPVPDEAFEPQRLWVRGLSDTGEVISGKVVGVPELGFADMDERPQVDRHVGTQKRLLLGVPVARVVFLRESRG